MTTVKEFQARVKHYERERGLSFRESLEAALNESIMAERQRCIDDVLSVWTPISEDSPRWRDCQNSIHKKIRSRDPQRGQDQSQEGRKP